MECTLALYKVDKDPGCLRLRLNTTDKEQHSTVIEEEVNKRAGLKTDGNLHWCITEQFVLRRRESEATVPFLR